MASTTKSKMSELLRSHNRYVKFLIALTCVAVGVGLGVFISMRQTGVAKVHEVRVLECPYEGLAAHTHNADCYDEEGNLVCQLDERELHVHDESCYTEERTLVCGLEESEGHAHTEACYGKDNELTCGLEESEGHVHTDACYETTRTLTCGKEEITEEHVHGPGCFKTILVPDGEEEEDAEAVSGAQVLTGQLLRINEHNEEEAVLVVSVKAPAGMLVANAALELSEVDQADAEHVAEQVDAVVKREVGEDAAVKELLAAKMALKDAEGNDVAPTGTIEVRLGSALVRDADELVLVQIMQDGTARLVTDAALVNWDEADTSTGNEDTLMFWTSEQLTTYVIASIERHETADDALVTQEEPAEAEAAADTAAAEQGQDAEQAATPATTDAEEAPAQTQATTPAQSAAPEAAATTPATTQTATPATADMPAQSFEGIAGNVKVVVKAPAGAFPAGTTMRVKAIDADEAADMVSALPGMYDDIAAVDITFYDATGAEIEPRVPINVTMTNAKVTNAQGQSVVVHVDDAGEASVVTQSGTATSTDEVIFNMQAN